MVKPSELALSALRLNQARFELNQRLQNAETVADVRDAVHHTDREIRVLAGELERFAARLSTRPPRPLRYSKSRSKSGGGAA